MPDFKDRPESARHEQIFCGQYYDDMCCTGFLGDPAKDRISVLMLGLSDGVALAPIAASTRVASLLAVDLDETALMCSLDNRNRLAAHIDFDSVVAMPRTSWSSLPTGTTSLLSTSTPRAVMPRSCLITDSTNY